MYDIKPCPYCKEPTEADFVDIGIGMLQCGPYHCDNCGASEIGSYDKYRDLMKEEKETGWYYPNSEHGSSANVIDGKVVSANKMKHLYQNKFKNNPMWHDKGYVKNWFRDIRKKK